jgi:hypothetical protein
MRSVNVKFHEFIMHRIADMNISLLYFFEFFTLEEQELERTTYMKDVILYEAVPTKSISSFLELYFIFYEFSNFRNGQVQKKLLQAFLFTVRCMPSVNSPAIAGRTCYGRGKGREKGLTGVAAGSERLTGSSFGFWLLRWTAKELRVWDSSGFHGGATAARDEGERGGAVGSRWGGPRSGRGRAQGGVAAIARWWRHTAVA